MVPLLGVEKYLFKSVKMVVQQKIQRVVMLRVKVMVQPIKITFILDVEMG
jgi:hypothetical protein